MEDGREREEKGGRRGGRRRRVEERREEEEGERKEREEVGRKREEGGGRKKEGEMRREEGGGRTGGRSRRRGSGGVLRTTPNQPADDLFVISPFHHVFYQYSKHVSVSINHVNLAIFASVHVFTEGGVVRRNGAWWGVMIDVFLFYFLRTPLSFISGPQSSIYF